jgi:hypothetical protein
MAELLSLAFSFLAIGLALYAILLTRKMRQVIEEGPLALWEEEVAELSEELARTAQQISTHLSRRREELSALIVRAEQVTHSLQTSEVAQIAQGASTGKARADQRVPGKPLRGGKACTISAIGDQEWPAEDHVEVNRQIRLLASQGMSVTEIAHQTRLSQEEITMRLGLPA